MDDIFFRKFVTITILAILLVLSFFLVKPIFFSVTIGLMLSFIFSSPYDKLHKLTKSKNFPVILIGISLIILIIIPTWLLTPLIIDESIKLYLASQQLDLITPLKNIFPDLFASEEFSQKIGLITQSFVTKLTGNIMNYFSNVLLDFPRIILQIFVVFFTFFYTLKDKNKIIDYVQSLLPFSKDIQKRLLESTRDITFSVLYGQVIIGTIQGIILGIGFFILGIPNAFILFILGILVGILPILGPSLVGIPSAIFLLVQGDTFSAIGILIFTFISSFSDQLLRPFFVSKRTKLHKVVILVGMVGGFLFFGILGFILGPLILAYLIIILETYRNKSVPSVLIQPPSNK